MFLFVSLLHFVGMVVVVCESVMNGREIEIVVTGHALRVFAFVDDTGSDMKHADASAVDLRLTTKRALGRDDVSRTRCSVRIDKEVRLSVSDVLSGVRARVGGRTAARPKSRESLSVQQGKTTSGFE